MHSGIHFKVYEHKLIRMKMITQERWVRGDEEMGGGGMVERVRVWETGAAERRKAAVEAP